MVSPKYLGWRLRKIRRRAFKAICSRTYLDIHRDLRRSVMLAGSGRSGTTWLAEIIASQLAARIMFEPFHAPRVEQLNQLHYFHYLRPTDANATLTRFSRDVFSGQIRHRWIDRSVDRLLPRFRVIKEIRANLFLKWLHLQFPQVPLVFILRHPCAVVLSRMELEWATDSDIAPFLAQSKLIDDHLAHVLEVIHRARTPEEKHAIVWCVTNLVPLRQFAGDDLAVVFYEDLCTQPDRAVPAVFRALGQPYQPGDLAAIAKPSSTARPSSAVVQGGDAISRWTLKLTSEQVRNILNVVEAFGLAHLYGDALTPLLPRTFDFGLTTVRHLDGAGTWAR